MISELKMTDRIRKDYEFFCRYVFNKQEDKSLSGIIISRKELKEHIDRLLVKTKIMPHAMWYGVCNSDNHKTGKRGKYFICNPDNVSSWETIKENMLKPEFKTDIPDDVRKNPEKLFKYLFT